MDIIDCTSLDEVRAHIASLDQRMVGLLAERGAYVQQAARFKRNTDEVQAPKRVAAIIERVRALAIAQGGNPEVTEATYRAMIAAFIEAESAEHARLHTR